MSTKEKVLILSYYFPPCNLTPSERIFSWAKYLSKGNYYPIIVTRNWDTPITNSTTDAYKSSGSEVKIEKHDDYEVHYLPYKSSLKDRLFINLDGTKLYIIYLVFALIDHIKNLLFVKHSSFSIFYSYVLNILKTDTSIDKMVVSASPYELFGLAYHIHKERSINWIADYRDDWSTSEVALSSVYKKKLNLINKYYEKKWLSNCSHFMSVSEHYVNKITLLTGKQGRVLSNGYLAENYLVSNDLYESFTITYVGSIYSTQPIELFIKGIIEFIIRNQNCKLTIQFVGIKNELPIINNRIMPYIIGYEKYFVFTERVSKKEAINIQSKSHLLFICSHHKLKGIPGSKLYEYIALRKNVLVYPTDGDIIEKTLMETRQGLICHNMEEMIHHVNNLYQKYDQGVFSKPSFNEAIILTHSREGQTNILIDILKTI
jgi:hypothetical protein